jgi:hypothetical protein
MNTPTNTPAPTTADRDAAAIAKAKAALDAAKQARRDAERQAEATREAEHEAAGRVAVAIANAIRHGADPVLVLPAEMLNAHRNPNILIIASPAELTLKRLTNSLSITGSRFPGWMEITVAEIHVRFMPTPMYWEWSKADEARRESLKKERA